LWAATRTQEGKRHQTLDARRAAQEDTPAFTL
jgi:hypothetical protein